MRVRLELTKMEYETLVFQNAPGGGSEASVKVMVGKDIWTEMGKPVDLVAQVEPVIAHTLSQP